MNNLMEQQKICPLCIPCRDCVLNSYCIINLIDSVTGYTNDYDIKTINIKIKNCRDCSVCSNCWDTSILDNNFLPESYSKFVNHQGYFFSEQLYTEEPIFENDYYDKILNNVDITGNSRKRKRD